MFGSTSIAWPYAEEAGSLVNGSRIALDLRLPVLERASHSLGSVIFHGTRLAQLLREPTEAEDTLWLNNYLGVDLHGCKEAGIFAARLPFALSQLSLWAVGSLEEYGADEAFELIHSLGKLVSWHTRNLLSPSSEGLVHSLPSLMSENFDVMVHWLAENPEEDKRLEHRSLWVYWMRTELLFQVFRVREAQETVWSSALEYWIDQLLAKLLRVGFSGIIRSLRRADGTSPIYNHCIDVWVSLIHLHDILHRHFGKSSLWERLLIQLTHLPRQPSQLRGELIWAVALTLTTLSRFSVLGTVTETPMLPACWPLISLAIKEVILSDDPTTSLDLGGLRKRDLYLRGLLARCLLLRTRWKWSLSDSFDLLNELRHVFASRQFKGLHGEPPGFSMFITNPIEANLANEFHRDSAFDFFLKLIILAIQDGRSERSVEEASKLSKKLLSMALPVSYVQFDREHPPTEQQLSGLYNRYSVALVVAKLDATTFAARVRQARRYSDFGVADWSSREANIRAVMYFAMAAVQSRVALGDVTSWMRSIDEHLINELRQHPLGPHEAQKNEFHTQLLRMIQLSLGSRRLLFESMIATEQPVYPDPELLIAGQRC